MLAGVVTRLVAAVPRMWSWTTLLYALVTLVAAIFLQGVITFIRLFASRKRYQKALKDFPGPKPHWLYGNVLQIMGKNVRPLEVARKWTAQFPDFAKISIQPWSMVLRLCHARTVKTILSTSEPKDLGYDTLKPWIGDGLLVSRGKKWARNRRLLTPAFHFDILRPYTDVFSECANTMVQNWKVICDRKGGEQTLEMFEHVSLMTLDSLLKCIFGTTTNCQNTTERHPYIKAIYEISDLILLRFRYFLLRFDLIYYLTPYGFRFRHACKTLHEYSRSVIGKKQEQKMKCDSEKKKYIDFIDILLDAKDSDGVGLTDQEIQEEVDTFMFEGHDTTASGISWCLYNLARHPEYQTRAREEVMDLMGERDNVTWDDLGQMQYLTQCIKESLRTHPPVPSIGRITTKPFTFYDGKSIPEGMSISCSIYGVHHNPDLWPDPVRFDPERFSPENAAKRDPHSFIPFSAGPRNCIGQHFALNELKTCVAVVLRHFELSTDPQRSPLEVPILVIRARGGLWLNVRPLKTGQETE